MASAVLAGQLELLVGHETTTYPLVRLWGLDSSIDGSGWWAWRCTCGRDVGAEQRAAYSGQGSADQMAAHHRDDSPLIPFSLAGGVR